MSPDLPDALRGLPAVHELAAMVEAARPGIPPTSLREACRSAVSRERERVLAGEPPRSIDEIALVACSVLDVLLAPTLAGVINATGVVLHTALGRACLPDDAVRAVSRAAAGYGALQWDRQTGRRGHRDVHVEDLVRTLTGAEAATVVNNNAGATLLVLTVLAAGREVIVSRGQLVEIGGSFRIPDVMRQSGAVLREVGCTNRVHLRDYREAIGPATAAILRVHPSNYVVRGFTKEVPLGDLVALGAEAGIPVIDDLGAGSLVDLSEFGLPPEPTVRSSIETGAALVTSSGDKLIGGPQAGIIAGRAEYVNLVRKHPLARALRVGKLTVAALQATLRLFLEEPAYIAAHHPVYRMFARRPEDLRADAEELIALLSLPAGCSAAVIRTDSYTGSGALPDHAVPSWGVAVSCPDTEALGAVLRLGTPAVASRIENGVVKLDMRTLQPGELAALADRIQAAAGELWA